MFEHELRTVMFITGDVPRRKPIALPSNVGLPKGVSLIGAKVALAPSKMSPPLSDCVRGAMLLVNPPHLRRARKVPVGARAAITLPFKVRAGSVIELAYTVPPMMPGGTTQQTVTAHAFARFATNATVPEGGYVFRKEILE